MLDRVATMMVVRSLSAIAHELKGVRHELQILNQSRRDDLVPDEASDAALHEKVDRTLGARRIRPVARQRAD